MIYLKLTSPLRLQTFETNLNVISFYIEQTSIPYTNKNIGNLKINVHLTETLKY